MHETAIRHLNYQSPRILRRWLLPESRDSSIALAYAIDANG